MDLYRPCRYSRDREIRLNRSRDLEIAPTKDAISASAQYRFGINIRKPRQSTFLPSFHSQLHSSYHRHLSKFAHILLIPISGEDVKINPGRNDAVLIKLNIPNEAA